MIKSGVYRLRNIVTSTFVDIGKKRNPDGSQVPVQGHPLPERKDFYDHQYWRFIQAEHQPAGVGLLQNVFSDLFLNMGGKAAGYPVTGFEGLQVVDHREGQLWVISEAPAIPSQPGIVNTWWLKGFNTGANLNLAGLTAGSPVTGAVQDNNSLTQRFFLEPVDLSGDAVESLIRQFLRANRCSEEKRNMDGPYRPVSEAVVREVHERYRSETFRPSRDDDYDCEDLAIEMHAAMAGRMYEQPMDPDRRMAFGILIGTLSMKIPGAGVLPTAAHAVNWFIDEVWRLRFFDATTGAGANRRAATYGFFLEELKIVNGDIGVALM